MDYRITQCCQIKNGVISLNGKTVYEQFAPSYIDFIRSAYKALDIDYPKFYKMDSLCKLTLVASSVLLENKTIQSDTALILANHSSCIDVDKKHQASIVQKDGYASPANFVYTLPNITLGEISIKYKLRSENSFFIFEAFQADFYIDYLTDLLDNDLCSAAIGGWMEVNKNDYNGLIFMVEKNKNGVLFTEDELQRLI